MKSKLNHILTALAVLALLTLNGLFSSAYAQGTAFTYQGNLISGTGGANGNYDFEFQLFNALTGGSQAATQVTVLDVGVTNGLFTVVTDFGSVYDGASYWLQIKVRTNGSGSYTTLSPRQELTPVPYSVTAENLLGSVPVAQLPTNVVTNAESGVSLPLLTVTGGLELDPTTSLVGASPLITTGGGQRLMIGGGGSGNNFFAGYNAGNSETSISDNTGIGNFALMNDFTGNYNSAFGFLSMNEDETGSYNTAAGANSLMSNSTGSFNIALGASAGINLTGSSNIDIGNPGVASDANTIRIGSSQTQTYMAGVINGNGAGLTNLNLVDVLQSDFGNDNFFAGQGAGNPTVGGQENVGVGSGALNDVTSGNYNTAMGVGGLGLNTNGSYNSAFGTGALAFHVTGDNNTAIGADAMALSGSGGYNTAIGADAMGLSGGSENTATGYFALEDNVSGANYNSAYGYYSMGGASATSGSANSGFGSFSLEDITSGYNNTAAGYASLQGDQNGVDNVALGVASLQSITDNSDNTSVGTYALQYTTNGQENIALGYAAGYDLLNGSNNIFIGNFGAASDNNLIRIGSGQSDTYMVGNVHVPGTVSLDSGDVNNGVAEAGSNPAGQGISGGAGAFLFGYYGGWLGTVGPTEVNLSWDDNGNAWVRENFSTATLTIRGGSDLAEPFKITPTKEEDQQGSVMVIDEEHPGQLKVSSEPYDTHVAGVLSGANGINPGIQMHQEGLLDGGKNVALTGRVYVQADASNGAIRPGDLLTTSSEAGRAMKVTDHVRAQGAILGKAMTGLSGGKGMVLVLVTLQ